MLDSDVNQAEHPRKQLLDVPQLDPSLTVVVELAGVLVAASFDALADRRRNSPMRTPTRVIGK